MLSENASSRNSISRNWFCQGLVHTVPQDSCPTGTRPVGNCMNSSLAKPSSVILSSWKRSSHVTGFTCVFFFHTLYWRNVSFPGTQYHGTGFCQGQVHTVPYWTSARRAQVLWNCMNESLAEPVPWYWVPGRGILRRHSNKLLNFKKLYFWPFMSILLLQKLVKSM